MAAAYLPAMNVAVIFYSLYGDTAALAAAVADGAELAGATVRLRQIAGLAAPQDRWTTGERIRATREHLASVPQARRDDLLWADGIALGSPARYGTMSAELRRFLDGARQLSGDLAGKVASVFCSPSPVEGAQRAALQAMIAALLNHGVLVQPPARAAMDPASRTARRDGPAQASPGELDLTPARALGRRLALAQRRTHG
ncbi:NAD(P)H-dependent oxidoreductase [Sorangium sp. So ce1078]|uniref:NAD(P)H-dependent oxidoreductase n=1 Tax=Sorangium sp. So ce1078 TaxID=3133329 RepID=UPI003F61C2BB